MKSLLWPWAPLLGLALPSPIEPRTLAADKFDGCTNKQIDHLTPAIDEAIELSLLSTMAVDVALGGTTETPIFPMGKGPINETDARLLLERWFGDKAVVDEDNATYIRDLFQRMHDRLFNDQVTFRCIQDYSDVDVSNSSSVLAFAGTFTSLESSVITQGPYDMYLLPRIWRYFEKSYLDAVDGWAENPQNSTLRPVNLGVALLVHELAHTVPVAGPKAVFDLCVLHSDAFVIRGSPNDMVVNIDENQRVQLNGYKPLACRLLALQDTNLAMHNADNYANFAIEVGMLAATGIMPPEVHLSHHIKLRGDPASSEPWIEGLPYDTLVQVIKETTPREQVAAWSDTLRDIERYERVVDKDLPLPDHGEKGHSPFECYVPWDDF